MYTVVNCQLEHGSLYEVKYNGERITSQYLTTTATHEVAGEYIVWMGMQQQDRNQSTQGVE